MERNFLGGNKFSSLCAWAGEPSQTLRKEKTFRAPKSFLKGSCGLFFLVSGWLPFRCSPGLPGHFTSRGHGE